ncbi:uncharacterized protein BCR38DRAFT_479590 [Pseudomassariella vexata]|uniref:Uncharacterized protein n=1 Tax=Pseudomassariella vexata TaxID=1141098 RepID=A0A1Y2EIL4_9PEZI|nr:uncharacterized protein BCR38DRAFT_479590 [Pseudomassariella vexata]ORY71066.1 hypothetical protein BCR38DRAFT_479590 [Pseudomassariella vexata]
MGPKEIVDHMATAMLLCCFEIHHASCTSGQWTGYLSNTKKIINASCTSNLLQLDTDIGIILDWVYYHDVLTRFLLRHWKREDVGEVLPTSTDVFWAEDSVMDQSAFSMLELLSKMCDVVSTDTLLLEAIDNVDDFKGFLNVLDWRIKSIPVSLPPIDSDATSEDSSLLLQLYQLALLLE